MALELLKTCLERSRLNLSGYDTEDYVYWLQSLGYKTVCFKTCDENTNNFKHFVESVSAINNYSRLDLKQKVLINLQHRDMPDYINMSLRNTNPVYLPGYYAVAYADRVYSELVLGDIPEGFHYSDIARCSCRNTLTGELYDFDSMPIAEANTIKERIVKEYLTLKYSDMPSGASYNTIIQNIAVRVGDDTSCEKGRKSFRHPTPSPRVMWFDPVNANYIRQNPFRVTNKNLNQVRCFYIDIDNPNEEHNKWLWENVGFLRATEITKSPHGWRLGYFFDTPIDVRRASKLSYMLSVVYSTLKLMLKADASVNGFSQYFFLPTRNKPSTDETPQEYKIMYLGRPMSIADFIQLYAALKPCIKFLYDKNKNTLLFKSREAKEELMNNFGAYRQEIIELAKEEIYKVNGGIPYIKRGTRNTLFLQAAPIGKSWNLTMVEVWELLKEMLNHNKSSSYDWANDKKGCYEHFARIFTSSTTKPRYMFEKAAKRFDVGFLENLRINFKNRKRLKEILSKDAFDMLKYFIVATAHYGTAIPRSSIWMREHFGRHFLVQLRELESRSCIAVDHRYRKTDFHARRVGKCKLVTVLIDTLRNAGFLFDKTYNEIYDSIKARAFREFCNPFKNLTKKLAIDTG